MSVRKPDFAGTWYPATQQECLQMFNRFEPQCVDRKGSGPLTGGLVPHAGYHFSGRVAYNVVRELVRHFQEVMDTVVLFGGHLGPGSPTSIFTEGEIWTPFGNLPVDEELAITLRDEFDLLEETPERYQPDNTVELQLPIIARTRLADKIVVIRPAPTDEALELAATVVDRANMLGRRIAVIGSTDLTHYGPNYEWTPKGLGSLAEEWVREENDKAFIEVAQTLDARAVIDVAIRRRNACCPGAAAAALEAGRCLGSTGAELLTYATSSEVRKDFSFVGYVGMLF